MKQVFLLFSQFQEKHFRLTDKRARAIGERMTTTAMRAEEREMRKMYWGWDKGGGESGTIREDMWRRRRK
ncbi:hypothetical protein GOBAR_DD01386 [Gossypium barbadense]|nr:hypothetical protein GOBAR_DD01386 [Gossypium barbadense]